MSETIRTTLYVLVGAMALAVAWLVRPIVVSDQKLDDSGERFFAQFDPLDAKSLEITAVNPETLARSTFKVAQQNGKWVIPSRENYPADAQDQLARAATGIMDVIKGAVASDRASDHELYGVADPTEGASPSAGSGLRVTLADGGGKTLVDLILGKAVKDSGAGGAAGLRYVRAPGKDRVYTAAVNTDSLTTKFEDWIERDLLQLDGSQISKLVLDDYSIDELNNRINRGDRLTLTPNPAGNGWDMEGLKEGEATATPKLDEMRTALDNLQIVDVHRKPAGLSAQLQTEQAMKIDAEAVSSLASRGYYIVNGQLLSNEGETLVDTREGIEYALRFGEIINFETGTAKGESPSGSQTEAGRFVFVTVRFDQALIPLPQYEPVPEAPAVAEGSPPPDDSARQAAIKANEAKKAAYDSQVTTGEEKAKKLNSRFSDWYYVVSDKVYQQIHLKRKDVVTRANESAPDNASTPPLQPSPPPAPTP